MIPKHIEQFLLKYSEFKMTSFSESNIIIFGKYEDFLSNKEHGDIYIDYKLQIIVNLNFPEIIPTVTEQANKIPKVLDNHVNNDGSFCLGAPVRIKMILKKNPNLTGFFEQCVLPYLFAVSHMIETGENFIFGELPHGTMGLLYDYQQLFELDHIRKIKPMLEILSMKRKEGNKQKCPCGCNKRVSTCDYFSTVQQMRKQLARIEWEKELILIQRGLA